MPHHGSRTSSSAEWLDAVQPKVAVAQVGYRHRFGHPHVDVVARYDARGIQLLRSDVHGAIEIQSRGSHLDWASWRQLHRRYWHTFPDNHTIDREDMH
jgi:competence protein ComEC